MLQLVHGGATARPFVTHSNALGRRLVPADRSGVVSEALHGGWHRARLQSQPGVPRRGYGLHSLIRVHHVEVYQAYTDYDGMAELTRTLYPTVARDVFGSTTLQLTDGSEYEISGEWAQINLFGAVSEALGEEISPATRNAELLRHADL